MVNPQLENGYISVATEIVDKLCSYHMSGNEWMIIWVVLRKTWGWHKKEDAISLTQFQKLTGLSRPSVSEALTKLVGKKVLVVGKKVLGTQVYSFNKVFSRWVVGKKVLVGFSVQASRVFGQTLVPKKVHTKDTNTKDTIQKIERVALSQLNDSHFEPIAQRYNVPIEFVRSKYDDMVNWAESNGKQKKDWIATLRNWVKKDAVQIRKEHHAKSKIANLGL